MEIIQSKQNASIKSARKLLQRKHRKTSYLLEGWHLFEEAKASGADILQVFVLEEMANAAGYDGVFLSDKSADIYNQKTLRSMQGSHFHLPIYRGPILDMVEACKKQGVPVLATTLSDISVDYKAVKTDGNFALVMGNEGQGISQDMAESADQLVHISMPGQAESLNVAVAAGILMFSL